MDLSALHEQKRRPGWDSSMWWPEYGRKRRPDPGPLTIGGDFLASRATKVLRVVGFPTFKVAEGPPAHVGGERTPRT
jgi:hypothetical protein